MIAPEALRSILRLWASGVTVVTCQHAEVLHGMTVSAFASVSLEPPQVSVNIERRTRTHRLMEQAGSFAVCILAAGQESLARRFGGELPDDSDRFGGLDYQLGELGHPILEGCLAAFECKVVGAHSAGTHTVFIGEVQTARADAANAPLLYFNRKYRHLAGD